MLVIGFNFAGPALVDSLGYFIRKLTTLIFAPLASGFILIIVAGNIAPKKMVRQLLTGFLILRVVIGWGFDLYYFSSLSDLDYWTHLLNIMLALGGYGANSILKEDGK